MIAHKSEWLSHFVPYYPEDAQTSLNTLLLFIHRCHFINEKRDEKLYEERKQHSKKFDLLITTHFFNEAFLKKKKKKSKLGFSHPHQSPFPLPSAGMVLENKKRYAVENTELYFLVHLRSTKK